MFPRAIAGFAIAVLAVTAANAATIHSVTVAKKGRMFIAEAEFIVDVKRDEVARAFTNFDQLSELNPSILSSHSEPSGDGRIRVTTRLRDCIVLFCKSITLVERVRIDDDGNLHSEIEPDNSDFRSGSTSWTFEANGSQTRVSYRSEVRPNFWVPPLLGRRAMRGALKRQIEASVANLEALGTSATAF